MNKTMIYGMLTALFALASCMGNGNPVSLSDLEGEWNVIELAGQSVNTKQQPFIGFDTREMRVYGYGGCNRLMGSFEWSDESARMVIFLGDLAFLCYMPGWLSWQGQPDLLLSIV